MINFASYSGRRRVSRDAGYSRMNALLATIQVSCLKIYFFFLQFTLIYYVLSKS